MKSAVCSPAFCVAFEALPPVAFFWSEYFEHSFEENFAVPMAPSPVYPPLTGFFRVVVFSFLRGTFGFLFSP